MLIIQIKIFQKGYYKNNYHSSNIIDNNKIENSKNNNNNSFENNDENEDEIYIDFTGNILIIQNCNSTATKNNTNFIHWIIDSGTGINLNNNINNLNILNKVNNKYIIYPNVDLDKVENVST